MPRTMSEAVQKENPRRPLARAKPKLRQNILKEKLRQQRQELARDVVALESNVVAKPARDTARAREAASEMAQARQSSDEAVGACFVAGERRDDARAVRRAFLDEEKRARKQGKRGVGAPQLRALLKALTGGEPTFAETFAMLAGRETLDCEAFVEIHRGAMGGALKCAALTEALADFDALCAALPDGGEGCVSEVMCYFNLEVYWCHLKY